MLSDRLNLPIDPNRLAQQDQILSLSGMTWEDYERLDRERNNYRISYLAGTITIVSPSLNHEKIAEIINGLIKTYCRKYDLLYFAMGSTTLKNPFTAGKEPDRSFSFEVEKDIPDLAIEVVFSSDETPRRRKAQGNAHQDSGGSSDLVKYRYLGVKEVWFWQNEQIKFYQLAQSGYVEIEVSSYLPNLDSEFLISFINRGLTESPLTIEADFISQLE